MARMYGIFSASPTVALIIERGLNGISMPLIQDFFFGADAGDPNVTVTYALTAGTLPAGLTLSSNGAITGNATSLGVYTFTVEATKFETEYQLNTNGNSEINLGTASIEFTVTVENPLYDRTITGSWDNSTPNLIYSPGHGLTTGDRVWFVRSNGTIVGIHPITVTDPNNFTLDGTGGLGNVSELGLTIYVMGNGVLNNPTFTFQLLSDSPGNRTFSLPVVNTSGSPVIATSSAAEVIGEGPVSSSAVSDSVLLADFSVSIGVKAVLVTAYGAGYITRQLCLVRGERFVGVSQRVSLPALSHSGVNDINIHAALFLPYAQPVVGLLSPNTRVFRSQQWIPTHISGVNSQGSGFSSLYSDEWLYVVLSNWPATRTVVIDFVGPVTVRCEYIFESQTPNAGTLILDASINGGEGSVGNEYTVSGVVGEDNALYWDVSTDTDGAFNGAGRFEYPLNKTIAGVLYFEATGTVSESNPGDTPDGLSFCICSANEFSDNVAGSSGVTTTFMSSNSYLDGVQSPFGSSAYPSSTIYVKAGAYNDFVSGFAFGDFSVDGVNGDSTTHSVSDFSFDDPVGRLELYDVGEASLISYAETSVPEGPSSPTSIPDATTGTPYFHSLVGSFGNPSPAATYEITGGSLPAGLTLDLNGSLTGTPTGPAGPYYVEVTATNALGAGTGTFEIVVTGSSANPPVTDEATDLGGPFRAGQSVSFDVSTLLVSGDSPITWSIVGSLPSGLTLVGTTLSGSVSVDGTYNFTIRATNADGFDDTVVTLTIASPAQTLYWHNLNLNNNGAERSNYSTDQAGTTPAVYALMNNDDLRFDGTGTGSADAWTILAGDTLHCANLLMEQYNTASIATVASTATVIVDGLLDLPRQCTAWVGATSAGTIDLSLGTWASSATPCPVTLTGNLIRRTASQSDRTAYINITLTQPTTFQMDYQHNLIGSITGGQPITKTGVGVLSLSLPSNGRTSDVGSLSINAGTVFIADWANAGNVIQGIGGAGGEPSECPITLNGNNTILRYGCGNNGVVEWGNPLVVAPGITGANLLFQGTGNAASHALYFPLTLGSDLLLTRGGNVGSDFYVYGPILWAGTGTVHADAGKITGAGKLTVERPSGVVGHTRVYLRADSGALASHTGGTHIVSQTGSYEAVCGYSHMNAASSLDFGSGLITVEKNAQFAYKSSASVVSTNGNDFLFTDGVGLVPAFDVGRISGNPENTFTGDITIDCPVVEIHAGSGGNSQPIFRHTGTVTIADADFEFRLSEGGNGVYIELLGAVSGSVTARSLTVSIRADVNVRLGWSFSVTSPKVVLYCENSGRALFLSSSGCLGDQSAEFQTVAARTISVESNLNVPEVVNGIFGFFGGRLDLNTWVLNFTSSNPAAAVNIGHIDVFTDPLDLQLGGFTFNGAYALTLPPTNAIPATESSPYSIPYRLTVNGSLSITSSSFSYYLMSDAPGRADVVFTPGSSITLSANVHLRAGRWITPVGSPGAYTTAPNIYGGGAINGDGVVSWGLGEDQTAPTPSECTFGCHVLFSPRGLGNRRIYLPAGHTFQKTFTFESLDNQGARIIRMMPGTHTFVGEFRYLKENTGGSTVSMWLLGQAGGGVANFQGGFTSRRLNANMTRNITFDGTAGAWTVNFDGPFVWEAYFTTGTGDERLFPQSSDTDNVVNFNDDVTITSVGLSGYLYFSRATPDFTQVFNFKKSFTIMGARSVMNIPYEEGYRCRFNFDLTLGDIDIQIQHWRQTAEFNITNQTATAREVRWGVEFGSILWAHLFNTGGGTLDVRFASVFAEAASATSTDIYFGDASLATTDSHGSLADGLTAHNPGIRLLKSDAHPGDVVRHYFYGYTYSFQNIELVEAALVEGDFYYVPGVLNLSTTTFDVGELRVWADTQSATVISDGAQILGDFTLYSFDDVSLGLEIVFQAGSSVVVQGMFGTKAGSQAGTVVRLSDTSVYTLGDIDYSTLVYDFGTSVTYLDPNGAHTFSTDQTSDYPAVVVVGDLPLGSTTFTGGDLESLTVASPSSVIVEFTGTVVVHNGMTIDAAVTSPVEVPGTLIVRASLDVNSPITFTGLGQIRFDQGPVNLESVGVLPALVVAGAQLSVNSDIEATSLHVSGVGSSLDTNGHTFDFAGGFYLGTGASVDTAGLPGTVFNGSSFAVDSGDWNPLAEWYVNSTLASLAVGVNLRYSNAAGGVEGDATNATNQGFNTNWIFGASELASGGNPFRLGTGLGLNH